MPFLYFDVSSLELRQSLSRFVLALVVNDFVVVSQRFGVLATSSESRINRMAQNLRDIPRERRENVKKQFFEFLCRVIDN